MNGTYCGCGDEIGIPGAGRDLDVIVAVFFFSCLSENVAKETFRDVKIRDKSTYRYLEARTNLDIFEWCEVDQRTMI